jgi:glycosyltransferase involved in cell wall biosynthesis
MKKDVDIGHNTDSETSAMEMSTVNRVSKKVSIIITNYNYGDYLEECVQSAISQSYKNIEVILIDDKSTEEKTESILEDISKKYGIKIIKNKENLGVCASRNIATKECQGEYVLYLDADDIIRECCVELMMEKAVNGFDVVFSDIKKYGSNKIKIKSFEKYKFCMKNSISVTSLFDKKLWKEVGGFKENMRGGYEDYDFWLSLVSLGARFGKVDKPLLLVRPTIGSRNSLAKKSGIDLKKQIIINHPELYLWFVKETKKRIKKQSLINRCVFSLNFVFIVVILIIVI